MRPALLAALLIGLAWAAWMLAADARRVHRLKSANPPTTSLIRYFEAKSGRSPDFRLTAWAAYEHIPKGVKQAFLAREDPRFLEHTGFYWFDIARAAIDNLEAGKFVRGGSTVSQQLAKNLFLNPERSWSRKAHETVLTYLLERTLDKRRILELYLNVIELADGVYGCAAAAQHYFGKHCHELTDDEGIYLAARTTNPATPARKEEREARRLVVERLRTSYRLINLP